MSSDIRLHTALIIQDGNYYLSGRNIATGELIWRNSIYDAWKTRIRAEARSVMEKVGGEIYLFNPIAGQLRKYIGGN